MAKIAVVGSEEFTLGFELVGVEAYPLDKIETLLEKSSDIGIIIISEDDHNTLSARVKNQITRQTQPIVVILSDQDIKGSSLREQVIRALGVDLMK